MIRAEGRRGAPWRTAGLALAALMTAAAGIQAAGAAQDDESDIIWMRVEITKEGNENPAVKVNLPLSLIEVVVDSIDKREFMAQIEKEHPKLNIPKLWRSIRRMDGEDFLTVETENEHIRVWKDQDLFRISVREEKADQANIQVKIPLAIMDYLFESRDGSFSFQDLVGELRGHLPLTLVTVDKDDERIRIWLEER